jgi:hypothetical protein
MPSIYTYGTDLTAWEKTAQMTVAEARRLNPNKPVYVYLWPQYFPYPAYPNGPKIGDFVPPKMWRQELETLYPIADGVIIWSGQQVGAAKFSTSMPWFVETIAFIKEHNLH